MNAFLIAVGIAFLIVMLAAWRELTAVILSGRPTVGPARCDSCGEVLDDGTGRLHTAARCGER